MRFFRWIRRKIFGSSILDILQDFVEEIENDPQAKSAYESSPIRSKLEVEDLSPLMEKMYEETQGGIRAMTLFLPVKEFKMAAHLWALGYRFDVSGAYYFYKSQHKCDSCPPTE